MTNLVSRNPVFEIKEVCGKDRTFLRENLLGLRARLDVIQYGKCSHPAFLSIAHLLAQVWRIAPKGD